MRTVVPAGRGKAFRLAAGQGLRIGTIEGGQVVDFWAFVPGSSEWLSMEHTRGSLWRLAPRAGDDLWSNRRRAILRMTDDSSPGVHDTLVPACDQERYTQLGHQGPHRNCSDNYHAAVSELGLVPSAVPSPLNLFMNVPIGVSGELTLAPSPTRAGDEVTLEALVDLVAVLSACPQDLVPINGESMRPTDVEVHCPV